MDTTLRQKKGFTLIEVVLVLAIAGLIFLVVFLALPALQRSQRDAQRKQDLSRFMSQLISYSSNKNGAVPSSQAQLVDDTSSFVKSYLTNSGQTFEDPSTDGTYNVQYQGTSVGNRPTNVGDLFYYKGAKCGTDGAPTTSGAGGRTIAAAVKLEQGDYLCQDNA